MKQQLLFLTLLIALLSGCVTANYHIVVKDDESTEVKLVVEIDKVMSFKEVEAYIEENFYMHLEESNFGNNRYDLYETEDYFVFEAIKSYPMDLKLNLIHFGEFSLGGSSSGSGKSLPFYEKQSFSATMEIPVEDLNGYVHQGHLNEGVSINVHVSLPYTVKEHNADTVSGNRKTMSWNLDPYSTNIVHFTYVKNELYKPLFFFIGVGGFIVIRRKLKKRNGVTT